MKNSLIKEVGKLDGSQFRELELSIDIARRLRNTIKKYKIPRIIAINHLDTDSIGLSYMLVGAGTYTVLHIARVDTLANIMEGKNPLEENEFINQYPELSY